MHVFDSDQNDLNAHQNYDFRTSMEGKAAYVQAERLRGQAGVITNRLARTHSAV